MYNFHELSRVIPHGKQYTIPCEYTANTRRDFINYLEKLVDNEKDKTLEIPITILQEKRYMLKRNGDKWELYEII
jgi:hypothetical protein